LYNLSVNYEQTRGREWPV